MQIILAIIAVLSLLASFVIFAISTTAMQEIVAAVIGLNFTIAITGIAILSRFGTIGAAVVEYMTKKLSTNG